MVDRGGHGLRHKFRSEWRASRRASFVAFVAFVLGATGGAFGAQIAFFLKLRAQPVLCQMNTPEELSMNRQLFSRRIEDATQGSG